MKIWCVDWSGLGWNIHSELFFNKYKAEECYEKHASHGCYAKIRQVEDIWNWCARHFEYVVNEVLCSRDNGDGATLIYGMVEELREAAKHCGVDNFSADMILIREDFDSPQCDYALSIAWMSERKLIHRLYHIEGVDIPTNYPTIIERRSKWQKQ